MSALAKTTSNLEILTHAEADALVRLENVIEAGKQTFMEVGAALCQIRDERLYRSRFGSFEDYCRDRWGFGRAHAYRLVKASRIALDLSPKGDTLPTSETQVRPLGDLPPEERADAWQEAVEESGGKTPSASKVRSVVDERLSHGRTEVIDLGPGEDPEVTSSIEAERAAIREAEKPSDDEWLDGFEPHRQLSGLQKRTFREDALAWRALESARKSYSNQVQEKANRVRRMGSWLRRQRNALKAPGPERWRVCPAIEDGGCGGTGGTAGGCPKCGGDGYVIYG